MKPVYIIILLLLYSLLGANDSKVAPLYQNSSTPDITFTTNLKTGWNLISNPITNYKDTSDLEDVTIFTYLNNSWQKNPKLINPLTGFWIKVSQNQTIEFSGVASSLDRNQNSSSWQLLGSGHDIKIDYKNGAKVYTYSNQNWIKNPKEIKKEYGF